MCTYEVLHARILYASYVFICVYGGVYTLHDVKLMSLVLISKKHHNLNHCGIVID